MKWAIRQYPLPQTCQRPAHGLRKVVATWAGMPVSTTHVLVGGLFGAGVVAMGGVFNFTKLLHTFLFPLVISPLMATVVRFAAYLVFKKIRVRLGFTKQTCLCVGKTYQPVIEKILPDGLAVLQDLEGHKVLVSEGSFCTEVYQGRFLGINIQFLLDFAHYLSAGIVSFARGLNDTPKIVGLLLS